MNTDHNHQTDGPMSGNVRNFKWDARKEAAALRVAEGEQSDTAIAEQAGVTDRQLRRWKENPEFMARVQELERDLSDVAARFAVAKRRRRVAALDERWHALQRIITERAEKYSADPELMDVPGGKTGLLVRTVKSIGGGMSAREVEEFAVDTGLLKQLLDVEKQAAIEAGQWAEKRELSGPDGQSLPPVTVIEIIRERPKELEDRTQ